MNRESFQNDEVASVLNTAFTAIKMDREQYPDADQYYNNLLVAAGGTAGWPLSAILMPDGTPAWIGNYVTKDRLLTLLRAFAGHFERGSPSLESQLNIYRALITARSTKEPPDSRPLANKSELISAGEVLLNRQDTTFGGLIGVQKFPSPDNVDSLWLLFDITGDERYQDAVIKHLNGMLAGEAYDPIFGGFYRYTTTRDWTEPHFEKTLAVQSDMLRVYSDAFLRTGESRFLQVADDILQFVTTELSNPNHLGTFYNGVDSELDGKNGGAYLLSQQVAIKICNIADCMPVESENIRGSYFITTADFSKKNLDKIRSSLRAETKGALISPIKDRKVITGENAKFIMATLKYKEAKGLTSKAYELELHNKILFLWEEANEGPNELIKRQLFSGDFIPATNDDVACLAKALQLISLKPLTPEIKAFTSDHAQTAMPVNSESYSCYPEYIKTRLYQIIGSI